MLGSVGPRKETQMDTILRNARVHDDASDRLVDIGIVDGKIAKMHPSLQADGREYDLDGRLVTGGFIESHIHLDKSCILDRCKSAKGDLDEAIQEVAKAKAAFTPEDVYERGKRPRACHSQV